MQFVPKGEAEKLTEKEAVRQEAIRRTPKVKVRRWMVDECVTAAEAARQLTVSREAVRQMVQSGYIDGIRMGNTLLIPQPEVDRVRDDVPRRRGPHRRVPVPTSNNP